MYCIIKTQVIFKLLVTVEILIYICGDKFLYYLFFE